MQNCSYSNYDRISLGYQSANAFPSSGLFGFGLSAIFFVLFQSGMYPADTWILAVGIAYGGCSQILGGLRQWRKQQPFWAMVCVSYGLYWLSLVGFAVLPVLGFGSSPEPTVLCAYYFLWCGFSILLLVGEVKFCRSFQLVLMLLVTYFILFISGVASESTTLQQVSFYAGFASGIAALYGGIAMLVNRITRHDLLPTGQSN